MSRFYTIIAVSLIAAVCLVLSVLGNEVVPGKIPGGEFGVVYECAFPNTVKLDGDLTDMAWQSAPWHLVDHRTGTLAAPNDDDASIAFAAVADDKWLYVAIKVTDDKIKSGENVVASDWWKDDSVEIYVDPNHGETGSYETADGKWDSQIAIVADNIGGDIDNPIMAGYGQGADTGTKAAVVETDDGWDVEAAVPLRSAGKWNMKPKDGMIIGFNIHFNDDDDGGERDHKLIWSAKDVDDQSYLNPTRFADLKFVNQSLSVEPGDKLAAKWGQLKTE